MAQVNKILPKSRTCLPYEYLLMLLQNNSACSELTHWGRMMHICISKLTIIGSDNGLSPGRRQAIIWTNAEILLIGPLGTNFNETSIEIHIFSFKKIHLKLSSGKWQPFCLGLNELIWFYLSDLYLGFIVGRPGSCDNNDLWHDPDPDR